MPKKETKKQGGNAGQTEIRITAPIYQQIAADISAKIVDGTYRIGEKIYARSSLASQYGVSSETARRAICVLSDLSIVESEKGSGVTIISYENARKFVKLYGDVQTINDIKQNMLASVERQKKELEIFNKHLTELMAKTERFRSVNPFIPFQVTITTRTPHLEASAQDTKFWYNTGATIIAIKRGNEILLSPGPYAVFKENDTVYFIGDENSQQRVQNFLYPEN